MTRLQFDCTDVQVYGSPAPHPEGKYNLTITFNPWESFAEMVRRLAHFESDYQVGYALKALESEQRRRLK